MSTNEPIVASRSTFGPVIPCVAWNFNSVPYGHIEKSLNTYPILRFIIHLIYHIHRYTSKYIIHDGIFTKSCNRRKLHGTHWVLCESGDEWNELPECAGGRINYDTNRLYLRHLQAKLIRKSWMIYDPNVYSQKYLAVDS